MADYFALAPLRKIALDTLTAEFDSKIGPLQLQQDTAAEWLPELCDAIRLVYTHDHYPVDNTCDLTPIRAAFVGFVHTARFFFLQNADFNRFLDDSDVPNFALDPFRAMRDAGDFCAYPPEPYCSFCRGKPTRGDKPYYTHLASETMKLTACCSTCAGKRNLGSGMSDWTGKTALAGT